MHSGYTTATPNDLTFFSHQGNIRAVTSIANLLWKIRSILNRACVVLIDLIGLHGIDIREIDRIVGPAMGAVTLAHELARGISEADRIRYQTGEGCLRAYTEKMASPHGVRMIFGRTKIKLGERILLAEDVITTGESLHLTCKAVVEAGGLPLPIVVALVNRSGLVEIDDRKIIALVDCPMPTWSARECPLCRERSEALRPKSVDNWERLNAKY